MSTLENFTPAARTHLDRKALAYMNADYECAAERAEEMVPRMQAQLERAFLPRHTGSMRFSRVFVLRLKALVAVWRGWSAVGEADQLMAAIEAAHERIRQTETPL